MWKWKEDDRPAATPARAPDPAVPSVAPKVPAPSMAPKEVRPVETPKTADSFRADVAHIGKSVIIKGELSGSEDLYLDGEVEGTIELDGHRLTIGPHGRVRAAIRARDVVVHGKVDGNIQASERLELKKTSLVVGDLTTQRIVIEDGAYFKGGIDIQKTPAKDNKRESAAATTAPAVATAAVPFTAQASLLEKK